MEGETQKYRVGQDHIYTVYIHGFGQPYKNTMSKICERLTTSRKAAVTLSALR